MTEFRDMKCQEQLDWRGRALPHVQGDGYWGGRPYHHILPTRHADENLVPAVRSSGVRPLDAWLAREGVQAHTGRNNLLSSWTLCANLYFPFATDAGRNLLRDFLADRTGLRIASVYAVELEYAAPGPGSPAALLGETGGARGTNQTSPDVAFLLTLEDGGKGVVLTEVKFVEHSFYSCSGAKALPTQARRATCWDYAHVAADPLQRCAHATQRGRRYWERLEPILVKPPSPACPGRCPAATAGYQLFRQHALAQGLLQAGVFSAVVSAVATDRDNQGLHTSLRTSGIGDIRTDWAPMFTGGPGFAVFHHQEWVGWVRSAAPEQREPWMDEWLAWIGDRYGY